MSDNLTDLQQRIEQALAASVHRPDYEAELSQIPVAPPRGRKPGAVQFKLRTFGFDRTPIELHKPGSLHLADLVGEEDPELRKAFAYAEEQFDKIAHRKIWIVKGPSGKDSGLTLALAWFYTAARPWLGIHLITVQNDVLVEVHQLRAVLNKLVDHCHAASEAVGIQHTAIVTTPALDDRYWVMTLGHGYPPFNRKFRPCTDSMKIKPSEAVMRKIVADMGGTGEDMAVLLGIRTEESTERAERYADVDKPKPNKEACLRGEGECGLVASDGNVLSKSAPKGIMECYPILRMRKCRVMDALWFIFPQLGWPTDEIVNVYGDEDTRFGCHQCPLVTRVKDVEMLAQQPGNDYMDHILKFRADYLFEASLDENRLHIFHQEGRVVKNGPGKGKIRAGGKQKRGLTLEFRQRWLAKALELDEIVYAASGYHFIEPEEVEYIRYLWEREIRTGKRGKAGRGKGA